MLWTRLRGRQLGGFKFVRQEPIDRYYVDFVCRERRLIIELDGGQHSERPEDGQRDSELSALGYRVIRIWNNDIIENLDGVLQTLLSELKKWPLTPPLSPGERAGVRASVNRNEHAENSGLRSPYNSKKFLTKPATRQESPANSRPQ